MDNSNDIINPYMYVLIKVNKDLIDRNELLLAEMLVEKIEEHERNNKKGE
ncbi:hypothetical protein [Mammaliicoccus lentus]|nr:hypothetical protein [Mammaliicoccus lentus]